MFFALLVSDHLIVQVFGFFLLFECDAWFGLLIMVNRIHAPQWRTFFCWTQKGNVLRSSTTQMIGQQTAQSWRLRSLSSPKPWRPMPGLKVGVDNHVWTESFLFMLCPDFINNDQFLHWGSATSSVDRCGICLACSHFLHLHMPMQIEIYSIQVKDESFFWCWIERRQISTWFLGAEGLGCSSFLRAVSQSFHSGHETNCIAGFCHFAAEIAMFENNIVIYKFVQDLHFFVTGGDDENELILAAVLQGFFDAVALLLRYCRWCFLLADFCKLLLVLSYSLNFLVIGIMSTRGRPSKTWILFFCASMRLLMEGMP